MDIQNIVLVGAGNVATHLGTALRDVGYRVAQVFSRTEASASELAGKLGCPFTADWDAVEKGADLYIVSVKDSALAEVLPRLRACNAGALYVHTAGSIPMDVWEGCVSRYGVLYPMQTFSKQRAVDFSQVSFFVEAAARADVEVLEAVASRLGGRVYEATSEQRRYLHVAAVFACNFTNHMYAVAHRLLSGHGLPFEAMLPLIDETARKIHSLLPEEAQTGPAVRSDQNVMASHLQMLAGDPLLAEMYALVSRNIHEYAT